MPSQTFESFGSATTVTAEQLKAATSAVLTALKDATGIDLTALDPFKAELVAASSTTPTGNTYDQLLDQLGAKVSVEALPLVVNQIANTASSTSTGEGSQTLQTVMQSVNGGSMPGCGQVMSGRYRFVEYTGRVWVNDIDFANKAVKRPDGTTSTLAMGDLDPAKPCEFTMSGTNSRGDTVNFNVTMGLGSSGGFHVVNSTTPGSATGYVFPVQSHPLSAITGDWTLLNSGLYNNQWEHVLSKITFGADGKTDVCDYDTVANPVCLPVTPGLTVTARTDGGFDFADGDGEGGGQFWLYQAPNGLATVYGSTNPTGDTSSLDRTHLVATRQRTLTLPEVSSTSKYTQYLTTVNAGRTPPYATTVSSDSTTVTAVDAATSTVTRQTASDGRTDTLQFNYPIPGTRFRPAGSSTTTTGATVTFINTLQMPVGTGMLVVINTDPNVPYTQGIVVTRP
jgi:hypothetical protein